jgi:hypothetical protein
MIGQTGRQSPQNHHSCLFVGISQTESKLISEAELEEVIPVAKHEEVPVLDEGVQISFPRSLAH